MHIEIFKLKFVNVKNGFLHFAPASFYNMAVSSVALKADTQDGTVFYFSSFYSANGSLDDDCVGISASYAKALGLNEDQHLVISTINNVGSIRRLHVSPETSDDLEIVYSSTAIIESQLLSQLRIVWPGQVFCAWVSSNICISLVVDSLSPELQYGRLEEYTEIVVNAESKRKTVSSPSTQEKSTYSRKYHLDAARDSQDLRQCRCIPIDDSLRCHLKLHKVPPFAAYLFKTRRSSALSNSCPVWKLIKSDNENAPAEVYVQLFLTEYGAYRNSRWTEILVSESIQRLLGLKLGAKVDLIPLKDVVPKEAISAILISPRFPFNNTKEAEELLVHEVQDSLLDYALFHSSILLNNKGEVTLKSGKNVQLTLRPLNISWSFLSNATVREISFSCNEFHPEVPSNYVQPQRREECEIWRSLVDCDDLKLVDKVSRTDAPNSHLQANLLITGRSGCGKTDLSKALLYKLSGFPYYFHRIGVDCLKLKGKRIEVIVRVLKDSLKEAVDHQPSIVLLENVDAIASLPNVDHVGTEATLYTNRLAHKLVEILEEIQRINFVSFVGTATSVNSVHPKIYSPRGKCLFTTTIPIPEHSKVRRKELLRQLITTKAPASVLDELELDRFASLTEGFLIADLVKLVKTALFEAWQRKVNKQVELQITNEDLIVATDRTKPSYLEGVNLLKERKYNWSTVGGLKEAKAKLTEVIIWPTLYPHIMSQCPLKAQTGILVYGAPGTGKTILARASAHESSLNFITVKGPELMSKYIGQSEEGVRNVFVKAQSAKPCLLFFDEFESLAPRRGKDQTGVTDRVVNQLLTALDGVEPLNGVYVMAATSRPDLIDPALLRPGRIGTSVLCPFPDSAARADILSALSTNIELDDDVDFSVIAEATEDFSGADLKGLLSAAQLKVIDSIVVENSIDGRFEEKLPLILERHKNVALTQSHLLDALKDCKPSLGPAERRKYDRIYKNFLKPSFVNMQEQKVTLA